MALFREHSDYFVIYVVEQKFAIERGREFFKYYKERPNYIDNDIRANQFIEKIYKWISPKVPLIGDLLSIAFRNVISINIKDIIMAFSKIYVTQKHQAAGPDVIDPIIIQEGKVTIKNINHIVALHKDSILAPAIIIILKDNDFKRAEKMLCECPNGVYIKYIRNSGMCELRRVVNTGAENTEDFITSFSHQCFDTCSNTPRKILANSEWNENPVIAKYSLRLLQFRAKLLCDEKKDILIPLNQCICELETELSATNNEKNRVLLSTFLCIAKTFRVFCNDNGGKDIAEALKITEALNNDILKANIYKYAFFLPQKSIDAQNELLQIAYQIYSQNGMQDNAIYCKNNQLVRQFDTEGKIEVQLFSELVGKAVGDVPGLVGMAHICNNAGIAHMMTGRPDDAMQFLNQGLEYSKNNERFVQRMAIECNVMILKKYYDYAIEYEDIERLFKKIFDGMVQNEQLPFISARYIMNLLIIAVDRDKTWAKQLLAEYKVMELINAGLQENCIGSGQLLLQLEYLNKKIFDINLEQSCIKPSQIVPVTGKRKQFIEKTGMNPFYFFTWL